MPAASSIYWNSIDSQNSSGSSADAGSARHYIDPWDLENYAYLRRHSVASPPKTIQPPERRISCSFMSPRRAEPESDYWPSCSVREPGYHAPASVDELYFKPRPISHPYQPIYEDEVARYSAPVYTPLPNPDYPRQYEQDPSRKDVAKRSRKLSQKLGWLEGNSQTSANARQDPVDEFYPRLTKTDEQCYVEVMPASNIGLNNYGHLKIDYTNSWNSLHRKISK